MRLATPALDPQAPQAADAAQLALQILFLQAAWEVWRERRTMPVVLTLRAETVHAKESVKPENRAMKYVLQIGERDE